MLVVLVGLFHLISASSSTDIRFSNRCYLWYFFRNAILNTGCTLVVNSSSNLVGLYLIICSTLNGPIYWVKASLALPSASIAL